MKRFLVVMFLVSALISWGCDDGKKTLSEEGIILIEERSLSEEEIEEECPNGGVKIVTGFDKNGNGVLDEDEIYDTYFVCHGKDGTDGDDGRPGTDGKDGDDGTDGEDGTSTLTEVIPIDMEDDDAPDHDCENGGYWIITCEDDGDGECVEDTEVFEAVCHGVDGEEGQKGETGDQGEPGDKGEEGTSTLTKVIPIDMEDDDAPDHDCENGGYWVITCENDGEGKCVEETEVFEAVCHGEDGEKGTPGDPGDKGAPGNDGACYGNSAPVIDNIKINGTEYTGTPVGISIEAPSAQIEVIAIDVNSDALAYIVTGSGAIIEQNGTDKHKFTLTFNSEGVYYFSVIVSDGCQMAVKSFAVRVIEGFAYIPAGSFWMGSPTDELGRSSNETLHYVQLTTSFYMGKYEVTQGEFNAVMGYNPSSFSSCGDDCPVERVNWHEALVYANALSIEHGVEECFDCTGDAPDFTCSLKSKFSKPQDCKGYRLPTESEWEYAARAGTTTAFYNGDITHTGTSPLDPNLDVIGWYGGNSGSKTQPVGGKLANAFGLYDMSGNVFEWTNDRYQEAYPEGDEETPVVDPTGPESGSYRVLRGGSWSLNAQRCRSALRFYFTPSNRDLTLGFRLTRTKE